ncbi:MAG TPA: tRNA (adenosine(37)-N6)-threonylcarbamoyltransferase complex ATPase subunit type 1 TsaE [Dehalococcoidia bacterium]|nr:tRNA (adenosine(37)-N6)-threonylcarbamoyltransferase complex ATPase subunit type 1 TsaE [Dehalococcoidia bacterium]
MTLLEFHSKSTASTQKLGKILGELAQPGDVYFLVGNLGSGKTCLTQGIARGLGVAAKVISPTFILAREYRGRLPLFHIDLYRLDSTEDIVNLALEQYLDDDGLCVIEWAEKAGDVLPYDNLLIQFEYLSAKERGIQISPKGKRYQRLLKLVKEKLL